MSAQAAAYVRREAANLSDFASRRRAELFLERVKSVGRDVTQFARMGLETDETPLPGVRRLVRDGYRYDYQVEEHRIVFWARAGTTRSGRPSPRKVSADLVTKHSRSAGDMRVRHSHAVLNGRSVGFDDAFVSRREPGCDPVDYTGQLLRRLVN